ncbi:hypothetical protein D3C74_19070 [compost metagenome]
MITFDPNNHTFTPYPTYLDYVFEDPNGDALSYAIVQDPDPLSGLSLELYGRSLYAAGSPTLPTTFTVRATDPQGLYADLEGKLDFVPEGLSHSVVQASSGFTQIDLNEYFHDRDNEPLSFALEYMGHLSQPLQLWIEGDLLTLSGSVVRPLEIPVTATDGRGHIAYNTVELLGENLAPIGLSQPMITFDPNNHTFTPYPTYLDYVFEDPNGDALSYAIVQDPDPLSGLSLELYGRSLYAAGSPTLPTTFTVRATDPQGLYADLEGKLDFVPEGLSHSVVQASSGFTQIDLNEYFHDRDNEPLSFGLEGGKVVQIPYRQLTMWIEGDLLTISGSLVGSLEIPVRAWDEQGHGVGNTVELMGEDQASMTLRQAPIMTDPTGETPEETPTGEAPEEAPTGEAPEEAPTGEAPEEPPTGEATEEAPTEDPTANTTVQESVPPSGQLSQVDLQAYFTNEGTEYHSYTLEGDSSGEANAWIEENILYISGEMPSSQVVAIRVEDEQGVSEVKYVQLPQTE